MAETIVIDTDIAIIGGGAAGCYAAMTARRKAPDLDVLILEKAHIDRSGCLAGGTPSMPISTRGSLSTLLWNMSVLMPWGFFGKIWSARRQLF